MLSVVISASVLLLALIWMLWILESVARQVRNLERCDRELQRRFGKPKVDARDAETRR